MTIWAGRGIFRCRTCWLPATRGAWRVLWALGTTGRFEAAKADRVVRLAAAIGLVAAALAVAGCALSAVPYAGPADSARYDTYYCGD
jgi:hypothetical protein